MINKKLCCCASQPATPCNGYYSSSSVKEFKLVSFTVSLRPPVGFPLLLFKVDIFVSQSKAVRRNSLEPSARQLLRPTTFKTSQPPVVPNGTFYRNFEITWGDGRAKMLNDGELLTISLDKSSGSGFQSKHEYLFGKIDMQLKLVPRNSAGTVTAYYLSSEGDTHNEIDFEFLGNSSGDPYTLHTNVYSQGKGSREKQFFLWFDPTADFHTYSILWNPQRIIFFVDDIPIREFKNSEAIGVPFPKNQPMRIYSSLWNAEDWATQGGRVKTDWTQAPFTSSYRNFSADACIWSSGGFSCNSSSPSVASSSGAWLTQALDSASQKKLKWVEKNHMIYNYCEDIHRFPEGLAPECKIS